MSNQQMQLAEKKIMEAFELEGIKNQLENLLENSPKKIESFKTNIINMSLSYSLKDCSPESIIKCGLQALTLDLPLQSGQGYIVNYGGKAQFDCGYKGWQVLAKRAGFSVVADVVYQCDEFSQQGFGFDRELFFKPDFSQRKGSDDNWARENLQGVIVSILEDETGIKNHAFVEASMLFKIILMSPSLKTEKGKMHSPHQNWAEQMFSAKAIKQILSKFPLDLRKSSQLAQAIEYTNEIEINAQAEHKALPEYSQDRFNELFPKWVKIVESGTKKAMAIITQLSNSYSLNSDQLEKVMTLRDFEPIEGEKNVN